MTRVETKRGWTLDKERVRMGSRPHRGHQNHPEATGCTSLALQGEGAGRQSSTLSTQHGVTVRLASWPESSF